MGWCHNVKPSMSSSMCSHPAATIPALSVGCLMIDAFRLSRTRKCVTLLRRHRLCPLENVYVRLRSGDFNSVNSIASRSSSYGPFEFRFEAGEGQPLGWLLQFHEPHRSLTGSNFHPDAAIRYSGFKASKPSVVSNIRDQFSIALKLSLGIANSSVKTGTRIQAKNRQ